MPDLNLHTDAFYIWKPAVSNLLWEVYMFILFCNLARIGLKKMGMRSRGGKCSVLFAF